MHSIYFTFSAMLLSFFSLDHCELRVMSIFSLALVTGTAWFRTLEVKFPSHIHQLIDHEWNSLPWKLQEHCQHFAEHLGACRTVFLETMLSFIIFYCNSVSSCWLPLWIPQSVEHRQITVWAIHWSIIILIIFLDFVVLPNFLFTTSETMRDYYF